MCSFGLLNGNIDVRLLCKPLYLFDEPLTAQLFGFAYLPKLFLKGFDDIDKALIELFPGLGIDSPQLAPLLSRLLYALVNHRPVGSGPVNLRMLFDEQVTEFGALLRRLLLLLLMPLLISNDGAICLFGDLIKFVPD